ncbi:MAG: VOC family protein [Halofilum sp. (in: g-proteobacteria)]
MGTYTGADPSAIIDHLGLSITDCEQSRGFYDAALAPLGIHRVIDVELDDGHQASGYGREGQPPRFWISSVGVSRGRTHVAFQAGNQDEVRAFHRAALAAGGRDHGAPALRPARHPDYFAAFVYDPDGYNIEAVTHVPDAGNAA